MRERRKSNRIVAFLLTLIMLLNLMPTMTASAALGDLSNVDTGLTGDIGTEDTISLPITILDYEADGMLFEYAESNEIKEVSDFGATWYEEYTKRTSVGGSIKTGNYWSDVTLALKTGTYANYIRATWAGNTNANWTGNRAGVVLADFSESSTYTTDQVRYMVVVFRSNVRSGSFTVGLNRAKLNGAGTAGNYTGNIAMSTENNTNWTYAVLDLKTGSLGNNWNKGAVYGVYVGLPIDASGEWIDIAHVAFFSNKDMATKFGEYALTDGSDRGDNRAFGLLRSSRKEYKEDVSNDYFSSNNFTGIIDEASTIEQINSYGSSVSSIDYSSFTTLGYTLLGTFKDNGIANIGLLESSLSEDGYPVYKEEVVDYVAGLLKYSLEIPERTADGWKNYRYVKGTVSDIYGGTDLASALRTRINGDMGSYADASAKDLVGTWSECQGNIASYYDAAYFLLNSVFVDGSYNEPQDDYNYLILSAGVDSSTGDKVYIFDGGFTTSADPNSAQMAIDYNTDTKTIQNTSAAGKTHFVYEYEESKNIGQTTTLNPFLPVTDKNTAGGQTRSVYYQDDGVLSASTTKDTYVNRNYNFAMYSTGEFVYHADEDLFFDFEGDDDVYLFINGELVMDIGSAHSIDGVRFEMNDYVNEAKKVIDGYKANSGEYTEDDYNRARKLYIEEGNTYKFSFYYMERHGYGANIRIQTNFRVTDPSMITEKVAYQDGTQISYGSIVDKDKIIEYGFSLTNNGEENLFNFTFDDKDIGVRLSYDEGLKVEGDRVYDLNGGTLEASDLTAVLSGPGYEDITVSFADDEALRFFLKNITSDVSLESGSGLWKKSTVLFRGIGYKMSDEQVKKGVFDNTVHTTATNLTESKTLYGQANMRVFVPADPMYYEWAGHDLKVTKEKLIGDVLAAATQTDNILAGKVPNLTTENINKIEFTTSAGKTITYSNVTMDTNYDLTINYPDVGAHVFYVKVTYNSSANYVIVPILVNVTDVEDSVYVLDYGLNAVLTDNNELFKNDAVYVPGRTTKYGLLAISGKEGSYTPNKITFEAESDNMVVAANGTFIYDNANQKITYDPSAFMEMMNTIYVAVNVYESDHTPSKLGSVDINNEVQMYKSISVLPANVVYYEDDFPAIKYDDSKTTNVFKPIGSSDDLKQEIDQDQEYGQDDAYKNNSDMSAGTLHTIEIKDGEQFAYFQFKGTGFELIGRTNAHDSAIIAVRVLDSTGETVKYIPVITEFDNGADGVNDEIYQVPVIRVDGLELETYKVQIEGIPLYDFDHMTDGKPTMVTTYFYLDGLRIYQPIGASNDHYIDTENGAIFAEIRDMIVDGYVAAAKYDGEKLTVSSSTITWTENRNGVDYDGSTYVGNAVNNVNDYLAMGPNNEVYMNGTVEDAALIFYVSEDPDVTHSLQVGVHAVDAGLFVGSNSIGMSAAIQYGIQKDGVFVWTPLVTVTSGTEQYYSIDYTKCPYVDGKGYQVAVRVEDGMASFTSLKYNGLVINQQTGEAATLVYVNGILSDKSTGAAVDVASYMSFAAVGYQMRATAVMSLEDPIVGADVSEEPTDEDAAVDVPESGDTDVDEPTEVDPDNSEVVEEETVVPKDENIIPDKDNFFSREEFIKKLLEFLKRFWSR